MFRGSPSILLRRAALLGAAGLLAVITALLPRPAKAELTACNEYLEDIYVAIGYFATRHNEWISQGWWTVSPNTCTTILAEPLSFQFVYAYAEAEFDHWGGDHPFCITDDRFTIVGGDECESRGYDGVGFYEHDTGGAPDYTLTFH